MKTKAGTYWRWWFKDHAAGNGLLFLFLLKNTAHGKPVQVNRWHVRWIGEETGMDLRYLFKLKAHNGALHFSKDEKRYYYEKVRRLAMDAGMEFSVCYDGDESYNTYRYLWANPDDCCNNHGKVSGFQVKYDFFSNDFIRRKR